MDGVLNFIQYKELSNRLVFKINQKGANQSNEQFEYRIQSDKPNRQH